MNTAFKTDFYEFTMLDAMVQAGKHNMPSTFELFARRLPQGRLYGVVSGTQRAIKAIKDFRFTSEQIEYLEQKTNLSDAAIEYLKKYRFKGKIFGYREGDIYFPYSPILTIFGTFADSVILETVLLSIYNYDSAVASAASRMVQAAKDMKLIEMGSRRTNEYSAVSASRAAYIAGFDATSNVQAGMDYGIPISGTSAHAFTLAFDDEKEAFKAQVSALGVETTLLVDTYNIKDGIRNAIEVAGPKLGAIRIDSGDLHEETLAARKLLDELGAYDTKIILSSDIDEYTISELVDKDSPVDGVGAGTRVVTGSGFPTAGMVFKIVERTNAYGDKVPVAKKADGKKSIGGGKFAYRTYDDENQITGEYFRVNNTDYKDDEYPTQIVLIDTDENFYHTESIMESRKFHKETMETLPNRFKTVNASQSPAFTTTEVL